MGKYYALAQGEDAFVAAASEEHYKPQGPADRVPTDPVSVAVALADKIDTLVGFWAIDEKPTGSKDPYALRRAALGVIRLIVENGLRARLVSIFDSHSKSVDETFRHLAIERGKRSWRKRLQKTKTGTANAHPSIRNTGIESAESPVRDSGIPRSGGETVSLSLFRGGEHRDQPPSPTLKTPQGSSNE